MDKIRENSKKNRNEDRFLVSLVIDKIGKSIRKNIYQNTNFLDLSQQLMITSSLKKQELENCILFRGYEEAERKMLFIFPKQRLENINNIEQYKTETYNKSISIIRIVLPKEKRGEFEHRTYLGALMKCGVERSVIGDILVREDGADILVTMEIEKYLMQSLKELTRFKKSQISIEPISQIIYSNKAPENLRINVQSMRLDCIIAELARCSRNNACKLIENEKVFINFKKELAVSKKIELNDYITIRGKGRFRIKEELGLTKRGRIVLLVEK